MTVFRRLNQGKVGVVETVTILSSSSVSQAGADTLENRIR